MKPAITVLRELLLPHVDVPVVSKVPTKRPDTFIRVDSAAPVVVSPVHERVRGIIQVYSTDRSLGWELARKCRGILEAAEVFHDDIYGCDDIRGPEDFPDPDLSNVFRWQLHGILFLTSI